MYVYIRKYIYQKLLFGDRLSSCIFFVISILILLPEFVNDIYIPFIIRKINNLFWLKMYLKFKEREHIYIKWLLKVPTFQTHSWLPVPQAKIILLTSCASTECYQHHTDQHMNVTLETLIYFRLKYLLQS